jgi:DNA-binding CsgD family transcriptional regulator
MNNGIDVAQQGDNRAQVWQLARGVLAILQTLHRQDEVSGALVAEGQALLRQMALVEAQRWGLTPRQGEVWWLRQCGCSYGEIAQRLFISVNTVKRHCQAIRDQVEG